MNIASTWMIAQAPTPPAGGSGNLAGMFPLALAFGLIVFMMMTARSQKKREQKQKEEMHARLGKNHRVLTIGGIIGTVMSVKDDEVVLKVDETTNTKMTFLKSAIQRVMDEPATEKA
jgi:preprotein translocase subunit YajC